MGPYRPRHHGMLYAMMGVGGRSKLQWGSMCLESRGEFRDVKVVPNGPFATWKHSGRQCDKIGNPSLGRVKRDLALPTTARICWMTGYPETKL